MHDHVFDERLADVNRHTGMQHLLSRNKFLQDLIDDEVRPYQYHKQVADAIHNKIISPLYEGEEAHERERMQVHKNNQLHWQAQQRDTIVQIAIARSQNHT
jgi:DNA-binding FadR family transcriptional regulator